MFSLPRVIATADSGPAPVMDDEFAALATETSALPGEVPGDGTLQTLAARLEVIRQRLAESEDPARRERFNVPAF